MKVYLSGPIQGMSDADAKDWRMLATKFLEAHGHWPVDPMTRDYRGRETDPALAAEIVEQDKDDILSCDILLANLHTPSAGTSMEIYYAYLNLRRVISIVPKGHRVSPWVRYHSNAVVETLVDALTAIITTK
jgi:nucleoside 2-deoxyribosyltransferase